MTLDAEPVLDTRGQWVDLGYLGIMHRCDECARAARYVRVTGLGIGTQRDYRCQAHLLLKGSEGGKE